MTRRRANAFHITPRFWRENLGISIAAAGLYALAGSQAVDNLTDGRYRLADLLAIAGPAGMTAKDVEKAAAELVERRLWRKTSGKNGGWTHAEWAKENPTKAERLAYLDAEQARKKTRVKKENPRSDSDFSARKDDGKPPESARDSTRVRSKKLDVRDKEQGGYVLRNRHQGAELSTAPSQKSSTQPYTPPPDLNTRSDGPVACRDHLGMPSPPACGGCRAVRERLWREERDRAALALAAKKADREQRIAAEARQRAERIAACDLCDEHGHRLTNPAAGCRHIQPGGADRARRALAGATAE